ncbi:MAG: ABC transporter ATP-binding protein [Propionibacteriaceae bacterium]
MSSLHAVDVTCSIAGRVIVASAQITAETGKMTALVGCNGSGKSTLLRAMAGITRPDSGAIGIDQVPLSNLSPRERARRIAFTAQEEMPSAELSVGEFVALGRTPHRRPWEGGTKQEKDIVAAALERVGMLDKIDRNCAALSGGERRRAALARSFAQDSDLMLLDEPTNHLDISSQLHLLQLLQESGRTVLAAIHDLDLAMMYFDAVYVLHNQQVIAAGKPSDVLDKSVISQAFQVSSSRVCSHSGLSHLVFEPLQRKN